jgi:hypothetical protein
MENGNLSNRVAPRIVLVFEGALGFCTDTARYDKAVRKEKWETAIKYWSLNTLCMAKLMHLYFKKDVNIEVVTYLGEPFAEELRYLLQDLPLHRVWATTPFDLGLKVAYMPDLAMVYDPEPKRWLMYGGKGRYLSSINELGEGL